MNYLLTPIIGTSGIALAFGIMSSIGFTLFLTFTCLVPKLGKPVNHIKKILILMKILKFNSGKKVERVVTHLNAQDLIEATLELTPDLAGEYPLFLYLDEKNYRFIIQNLSKLFRST